MKYYDKCHDIFFVVDVNLCVQYVNLVYYKPIFQFHSLYMSSKIPQYIIFMKNIYVR